MAFDLLEVINRDPADPVMAAKMPLSNSAWPVTLIMIGYLILVLKLGKQFMAQREPYNLKKVILVYNVVQVVWNAALFVYGADLLLFSRSYDLQCIVPLADDHPRKQTERALAYLYYINKIADLMDTVFFILRKSYKQITFLHVYHHIMMVYSTYWVIRLYGAPGQFLVMGTLNTLVHTVMYFYYFMSAMFSGLKGSLWWKKYITMIQLIQFIIVNLQSVIILLFNPSCKFPLFMQYMQLIQSIVMITMFGKFYINSYMKPKWKEKQ